MHLADAFIQSNLQCIQAIHLYCQYVNVWLLKKEQKGQTCAFVPRTAEQQMGNSDFSI